MKIGISVGKSDYKIYELLKKSGFDCVDFDLSSTDTFFYTLSETEAQKLIDNEKKESELCGVEINQVHGPWRWPAKDFLPEDRKERMEQMKKSIRFTARLGCENFVIHPIMPFGCNEIDKPEAKKTYDMNLEFMRELLTEAKKNNVVICLENMPMIEFSLSKPSDILRFVKEIDDPNFKICLDTGHVGVFDDLSVGNAVRELGKEIRVLHVHDSKYQFDLHLPPFYGRVDWEDFMKALSEIEYAGVFSLETGVFAGDRESREITYKYLADIAKYLTNKTNIC